MAAMRQWANISERNLLRNLTKMSNSPVRLNHAESVKTTSNEPVEVKIPVPWGHVAAKWWGSKSVRPILCIHGWQDNSATFDRLIPLLPQHVGYLAIDLPGHGFSSRIPDGITYNNFDFIILFKIISKIYKWDKISIMAHSLGAICSFIYAGINSKEVDMVVGIDGLYPFFMGTERLVDNLKRDIDATILADARNRAKSEPPAYEFDDAVERLHQGSYESITREVAPLLLARGLAKSEIHPNKFYYTRDNRLKSNSQTNVTESVSLELMKTITCPYQFIRATRSVIYSGERENLITEMVKRQPNFEYKIVEGTHHLHLTDPESISDIISEFITRQRPPAEVGQVESKL